MHVCFRIQTYVMVEGRGQLVQQALFVASFAIAVPCMAEYSLYVDTSSGQIISFRFHRVRRGTTAFIDHRSTSKVHPSPHMLLYRLIVFN